MADRFFVFREGAFEWVNGMQPGDIDFTHNDDADEAMRVLDEWLDRKPGSGSNSTPRSP